eukprot:2891205-Pyramimonas_sp.AAC.1
MAFVGRSWAPSGGILGFLWPVSGALWAVVKRSGWPVGLCWRDIGGPSGRLRHCEDPTHGYATHLRFPE